ncbi:ImmA/IrrE family metallo-endopeptidase [Ectothiorhodospira shaposhnikovii]|uniref:ImmA/IrrE family metallo-endopeptidase n=1 Tax=Ectothiorhodospira shaposhnikovii TaxID=1054 RepID=UPI0039A09F1B
MFELSVEPLENIGKARLTIRVGGQYVTENEDFLDEHRVKRSLIMDPIPWVEWVAANWWRLRWEGEHHGSPTVDWRMSHCLSGAAGGIVWPHVCMHSDGEAIFLRAKPTRGENAALRFLNAAEGWVDAEAFEQALDASVTQTLQMIPEDHPAKALWADVMAERADPETALWRRLEARMGFDPDEGPESLIQRLISAGARFGEQAMEELAADSSTEMPAMLEELGDAISTSHLPVMSLEDLHGIEPPTRLHAANRPPWQSGVDMATQVRTCLGMGNDPVTDRRLSELLHLPEDILTTEGPRLPKYDWNAGLRRDSGILVNLSSHRHTGRRFGLARLLGDALAFDKSEKLLPSTRARTARQKYQRAFAQSLLCPYEALIEWMDTDAPDDDQIEAAAEHFQVSTRVVEHTLENYCSTSYH